MGSHLFAGCHGGEQKTLALATPAYTRCVPNDAEATSDPGPEPGGSPCWRFHGNRWSGPGDDDGC